MRPHSSRGAADPVLVDRASSFGLGFGPRRKRRGTLTLCEDSLQFRSADGEDVHEIPLEEIVSLGASVSNLGAPLGQPVLRVVYRRNLVLGVIVESPETWINAIGVLTRGGARPPRVEGRDDRRPRSDVRAFRAVVGMFLLLILLMSVAVPLFISWMQGRVDDTPALSEPEALPRAMTDPFDLAGRTAVVTGGGTGIGLGITRSLVNAGARVVICGRRADVLNRVRDELGEAVTAVTADVTLEADVERVAEAAGLPDIWVNNAGIMERGVFPDVDLAHLERTLSVNVKGVFLGCRAALRCMIPRRRGVILNLASYLADHAGASAGVPVYAASKGAVVTLTKSLAVRHGPDGIRVNAVCPALVPTELNEDGLYVGYPDRAERDAELGERYPLRRIGRPEDVGPAVVFLAGDGASWITGHALYVDGGISAV